MARARSGGSGGPLLGRSTSPGGEEGDGLPLGGAPLGDGVKQAQGVDLIPPELDPHRQVQAGGEHVQDAPPQGELAHPLHLVAPGVPRLDRKSVTSSKSVSRQWAEKTAGGMVRWSRPSTVAASTGQAPWWSLASTSSRWCSHWRRPPPGWNCRSRAGAGDSSHGPRPGGGPPRRRAHQHQGAAGGPAEPRGHIGPVSQALGGSSLPPAWAGGGPGEKAGETGSNGHRRNAPGKATAECPPPRWRWGDAQGPYGWGRCCVPRGGGSEATLGRSARCPACPAVPISPEKWEKEGGGKPHGPRFLARSPLVWGVGFGTVEGCCLRYAKTDRDAFPRWKAFLGKKVFGSSPKAFPLGKVPKRLG